MTIARQGLVVETRAGAVVRFPPGCSAADCVCGWRSRAPLQVSAAAIGLTGEMPPGRSVTLLVDGAALARLALLLFALPVAALLAASWAGAALAVWGGWNPDLVAALLGLSALGVTFSVAARNGSALLRMLNVRARMD